MTVSKPQNLGLSRSLKTVHGKKTSIWLNIDDKKISVSFVCKSPAKFWSGLGSMLMGVAIGILVVAAAVVVVAAVVGTGGAAGVILAGMAAAATSTATGVIVAGLAIAAPVAALIGVYKQSHACDCSLDKGSKWINMHNKVNFDQNKAIVQKSYLKCTNGGLIQPFLNSAIAQLAATKFAANNNDELIEHYKQQGITGFISGFTGLADPLGTSIGVGFSTYEYFEGNDTETLANESGSEEDDYKTDVKNTSRDNAVGTVAGAGKGSLDVVETMTQQNRTIIRELMDQGATYEQADRFTAFGESTFKGEFKNMGIGLGVGLGFGLAGSVANHYINKSFKENKKKLIDEVNASLKTLREQDRQTGLGVSASQK
ncbi:hypothetical protein [Mucilaginibacter phyllosphaerae]|nr:hypothetical protein [Mucilaginibacter phyllosphaerae]GGH01290.1 hypothetical protein GCM10007352_02960 [Mucilaginibacter phyllosphaerae]